MNASNNQPSPDGNAHRDYAASQDRRLTVLETRFDTILPTLATKADLDSLRAEVHVEFASSRSEFRSELGKLRDELHAGLEKLRGEFQTGFEKMRGEFQTSQEKMRGEFQTSQEKLRADLFQYLNKTIKWMFGLVVTALIGIAGINIGMLNAIVSVINRVESNQSALDRRISVLEAARLVPPPSNDTAPSRPHQRRLCWNLISRDELCCFLVPAH